MGRSTFAYWRQSRGLPKKGTSYAIEGTPEGRRRLRVVQEARTDKEAARILGVTRQAISAWRSAKGIASKKESSGAAHRK